MSVICFGEVLWDCLPAGLFLGGAPFNVAAHLDQLGHEALVASAVGDDQLGREIRRRMRLAGMDQALLASVDRPTGTVLVELTDGQPSYDIVDDVAWDRIPLADDLRAAAGAAEAVVFGSLAQRHADNRVTLDAVLAACPGRKVFDVNLRPPYVEVEWIRQQADGVDLIKLNHEELAVLLDATPDDLADGARELSERHGGAAVCVTAGAEGAGYWDGAAWHWADAPTVTVKDAVGAGDSFLACLLDGLLHERPLDATLSRCVRLAAHVASSDGATPEHPSAF